MREKKGGRVRGKEKATRKISALNRAEDILFACKCMLWLNARQLLLRVRTASLPMQAPGLVIK